MQSCLPERVEPVNTQLQHTVLIVDESPDDLAQIRRHVERAGVTSGPILEATKVQDAFELMGAIGIDVVLINVRLGEADVVEILARLRCLAVPRASFVLMIDEDDATEVLEYYQAGARAHLRKPFGTEELRTVLEFILK